MAGDNAFNKKAEAGKLRWKISVFIESEQDWATEAEGKERLKE